MSVRLPDRLERSVVLRRETDYMLNALDEKAGRAKTSVYLPVEDLPPPRAQAALTPAEQAKIKKELLAARDRQKAKGTVSKPPEKSQ